MQSYTKTFPGFGFLAAIVLLLLFATCPARAQFILTFDARVSHTNTLANSRILYSLDATNISGITHTVFITNRFSVPVGLTDIGSNFLNTTLSVTPTEIVAQLPTIAPSAFAFVDLQVIATNASVLTNTITFSVVGITNFAPVQLVTIFTNPPNIQTDVGVTVAAPSAPVLDGDEFSYTVTVTNRGATPVSGVRLTNTLPSGISFRNTSATNRPVITVGNLGANAGRKFNLLVRATSPGPKTVSASIGVGGASGTNQANSTATVNFTVESPLEGALVATNVTETAVLNLQNGLMEQTIRLVNIASSNVASARVVVSDAGFWLRNAAGTNNGEPYVAYTAPLAPGEGVNLVLQYFNPRREEFSVPNENYTALPTSTFNVGVPGNFTFAITNIIVLPNGRPMIEFPATPGRSYTILYSGNAGFSSPRAAIPSIVAQANKVQWIDEGPPKTESFTTNRFYRVLLNP